MAWHLEDDVGVILSGTEDACISWLHRMRQQHSDGCEIDVSGSLRLVNHNGSVVATLLGQAKRRYTTIKRPISTTSPN